MGLPRIGYLSQQEDLPLFSQLMAWSPSGSWSNINIPDNSDDLKTGRNQRAAVRDAQLALSYLAFMDTSGAWMEFQRHHYRLDQPTWWSSLLGSLIHRGWWHGSVPNWLRLSTSKQSGMATSVGPSNWPKVRFVSLMSVRHLQTIKSDFSYLWMIWPSAVPDVDVVPSESKQAPIMVSLCTPVSLCSSTSPLCLRKTAV